MPRILYLDDEPELVLLISRMLGQLGHVVSGFTNAGEALAVFTAHPQEFDLVLTDMSMLGMNGLEFAQQIFNIDPRATVVIATGCVEPNWAGHARAAGVRDVIEKPHTAEALSRAISPFLGGI